MATEFSSTLYKLLGNQIKTRREELRINQIDLGLKAGIGRASISNIESGRQKPPLSVLYQICNALDIDIQVLLPTYSDVQREIQNSKKTDLEDYFNKYNLDTKTQEQIANLLKGIKK